MRRIIICESGATKADWRVVENGIQTARESSVGMNMSTMKMDVIADTIREISALLPSGKYDAIYFYMAGMVTSMIGLELEAVLKTFFDVAEVEVQSDIVASARAACGHAQGIAVILGTGSNSCQWDGEKIVKHIKSGGFIIGDDGSASVLGKLFISDFIKGLVPEEIASEYARHFPHDYPDIVEMVYRNPGSPSGWLGSLCPFIVSHYSHPYIKRLVDRNFQAFIDRCLKQYDTDSYQVSIIGSFGNALQDIIRPIFESNGINIRAFIPVPAEELVKYHA